VLLEITHAFAYNPRDSHLVIMKKLSIKLKCCYGINVLDTELDFSEYGTYAIYAPNGVMKTSFAKTFKDLSNGITPKDLVFPERITEATIKDENGKEITPNEIFVIEPYNEDFNSDKLSTLLVTKELKDEYDEAYRELEKGKKDFITKLRNVSQSTDCETEFISAFKNTDEVNFFELLLFVSKLLEKDQKKYTFKYNDIFDKKGNVEKFLNKHKDSLDLYLKNYVSLISKSSFFKKSKNTFGTYQASEILKSISDNSFFEAGHMLELTDRTKIDSAEKFKSVLEEELKKVVSDKGLKKVFEIVDKALGFNVELRAFKAIIEHDNLLLIELANYNEFKQKVWLGYLDILKFDFDYLLSLYESRKKLLDDIINKAKEQETEWEISIKEFNQRFIDLPFQLTIKNKADVILKINTPTVEFIFKDSGEEKIIERDELLSVLSQGERRALYLLNIIFEIQARKKSDQKTLFIIDDIADSFDYKNKYAIIQYLKDISENKLFYQIIFTHNFDFFRTLESRDIVAYSNCFFTYKSDVEIFLKRANGIKNPFINDWKKNLNEDKKLIASIPFIRNIIEYTKGEVNENFKKLTSLLHWKQDSETILIGDLKLIFENTIEYIIFPSTDTEMRVIDKIFQEAEASLTTEEGINLENKIVLSIAIRLKAEKFMIEMINDTSFINSITKNQTVKLTNEYKNLYSNNTSVIKLLDQVNLMTPENIHINSFMYEPILDLGDVHLKALYSKLLYLEI
jgi:hypothetical protein